MKVKHYFVAKKYINIYPKHDFLLLLNFVNLLNFKKFCVSKRIHMERYFVHIKCK